jgi:hypothetical protein
VARKRHLKKSHSDHKPTAKPKGKYQFIFIEEQRTIFPVRVLCEVSEVSESGYDDWRKRRLQAPGLRQKADETF